MSEEEFGELAAAFQAELLTADIPGPQSAGDWVSGAGMFARFGLPARP